MMRGYLRIITLKSIEKGHETGYDIIKYIEEKTGRKPSSGSIYPLLEQLEKEELIDTKEEKRKKIHHLTKNGKEEIKHLTKQKNKLLDKLEEGMHLFATISNMKSVSLHIEIIKRMKEEDFPSNIIIPELDEFKEILLKIILNNPDKIKKNKIAQIIKKTTKELKAIK